MYGDYGVGKTYLSGTASLVPEMRDVLIIDAESGDLTLNTEPAFEAIDHVRVEHYRMVARVHEFLKLHCKIRDDGDMDKLRKLEAHFKGVDVGDIDEPRQYNTVIIDSLSEVETFCMYQLLGISDTTKLDEETASPEWAEYKRNHSMIQRLVRNFRDLPMHVILTCARNFTQDEMKKFSYSPAMTGKLSNIVQGFVDMVGYLVTGQADEEGNIPRRLYVQPSGRHAAKCRFSGYKKPFFENPTVGDIIKAVGLTHT